MYSSAGGIVVEKTCLQNVMIVYYIAGDVIHAAELPQRSWSLWETGTLQTTEVFICASRDVVCKSRLIGIGLMMSDDLSFRAQRYWVLL
jgi:hypothetical protein